MPQSLQSLDPVAARLALHPSPHVTGASYDDLEELASLQGQAEELQGEETDAGEGGERFPWSCLIFVSRKLGVLALDAVLRAVPSLSFLRPAPFMGHGGPTLATSMDTEVRWSRHQGLG